MTIRRKIQAYHHLIQDQHHRYRSWEHCYEYFQTAGREGLSSDPQRAALQFGFYLASWGMYRGSGFLLKHAYTVHLGVVDQLTDPRFAVLWDMEFGANQIDDEHVPIVLEAADAIRNAYQPFAGTRQPTDTLVTKVILGTFGCLPACDRFFVDGFKTQGLVTHH